MILNLIVVIKLHSDYSVLLIAGAIFSFVASVELLGTLISGVVCPQIFTLTLEHNLPASTIYFMMAALALIPTPMLL